MTSHFLLKEAAVFSGWYVYTRCQFELLCESDVLSEQCLTPLCKVLNIVPAAYLKLTFTQLSGVTLRRQIESCCCCLGCDSVTLSHCHTVTANAESNPSLLLRQEININVNARAPKSKMCQSEFSYHNKVNNRTAVPRSHLL